MDNRVSRRTMLGLIGGGGIIAGGAALIASLESSTRAPHDHNERNVAPNEPLFSNGSNSLFSEPVSAVTILDGQVRDRYYGLPDSIVIPASTQVANGERIKSDTWIIVCRSGASEGSNPPYGSGSIVSLALPGGPNSRTPVASVVYRPRSDLDARQPGVAILRDGQVCVSLGERSSEGPRYIVGGTLVVYSPDGGRTWNRPSDDDRPNRNGRLGVATDLSGVSGVVELDNGTVLCPWQGLARSSDRYQSSGYFIGTYHPKEPIAWKKSHLVVNGPEVGFDAVEPSLMVLPSGDWLFFIRDEETSTEFTCRSQNKGRTFSALNGLSTNDQGNGRVYGGVHPVMLRKDLVAAFGRVYEGSATSGVVWSSDEGVSWNGPLDLVLEPKGGGFDYGSIAPPPSRPQELWVALSLSHSDYNASLLAAATPFPTEWTS